MLADGLLQFAATPDEVAAVLAHEMGHVLHRHATASIIEAVGLGFLFATMLGDIGSGAIGGAGETLIGLSFRRARRKPRPTSGRTRSSRGQD